MKRRVQFVLNFLTSSLDSSQSLNNISLVVTCKTDGQSRANYEPGGGWAGLWPPSSDVMWAPRWGRVSLASPSLSEGPTPDPAPAASHPLTSVSQVFIRRQRRHLREESKHDQTHRTAGGHLITFAEYRCVIKFFYSHSSIITHRIIMSLTNDKRACQTIKEYDKY